MTVDERLDRLEHISAGMDERWRKEREEDRQLWRDTQRQIGETQRQIGDLSVRINDLALKIADTNDTIVRLGEEMRAADERLGQRIDSLVSAIGQMLAKPPQ